MKALSLTQPWASLMSIGAKINETRGWPCTYKGDVAICATKEIWKHRVPDYAEKALSLLWFFRDRFPGYHANIMDLYLSLPFGKVVCVVEKTDCISTSDDLGDDRSLTSLELSVGDYSPGRYFYPTTNCRKLTTPVPVVGRQGLFTLPPEVEAQVRSQL